MRMLAKVLSIALVAVAIGVIAADQACLGGCRDQCAKKPCACGRDKPCCPPCCAPTQPCQQYEEKEVTAYKTVYEEVVEKVPVPAVKYVEATEYRCVPVTVMQPRAVQPCEPAKSCAPCGPAVCNEMVPVQILKKVPYTVFREEHYQKIEERPKVVVKQVPYTYIQCVPIVPPCQPVAPCEKPATY